MNSRFALRVALVFAVFALFAASQATRTLAGTTGEISGTITDALTGGPIAGAQVTATAMSGTYKAISNTKGYFAIVDVYPDTYTVTALAAGYQNGTSAGNTVNQDQDTTVNLALAREARVLGRISVRGATSIVQPNTAPDQYVLNAAGVNATNGSGGSISLYQTPGTIGILPGVTTDASGYPHIRGSRLEEIGYEYDGLTTVEPVTGEFSTNLVNDGLARVEVSTGGYSASGGNAISGVVNTVVGIGAYPGRGSATFLVQAPTFYHGINFDWGNGTPDNRFTYYLAGVWWNSAYDWAARGAAVAGAESLETAYGSGTTNDVNPSRDQVANFHYKFGPGNNNDVQFLATEGIEHYDNNTLLGNDPYWPSTNPVDAQVLGNAGPAIYLDPATGLCADAPNNANGHAEIALFPGQQSCNELTGKQTDHDDQGYSIAKLQLTHNFGSTSFFVVRYARVSSYVTFSFPFGGGPLADVWENRHSDQQELSLDYTAQVSSTNLIKVGATSNYSNNHLAELFASSGFGEVIPTDNHDDSVYVVDTYRPSDRLTLDLSGRSDSRKYLRTTAPDFSDSALQGRLGFAYRAGQSTVLRGSYGNFVELPYVSRVERILTLAPNFTNIDPGNQLGLLDAQPAVPQNHSYDFALEQTLSRGFALKVNPFWRTTDNLVLSLHIPGQPFSLPQAVGPYYVNGLETELQFNGNSGSGWSGFIDYTHTRALSAVTGDYNQTISPGVQVAHALFPASYIPPNVANLVATYRHGRWSVNPNVEYVAGYPYGVGRLTYASDGSIVKNKAAYYADGVTLLDPGESLFADGRICCVSLVANLNLYYDVTPQTQVGIQIQNLNRDYRPTTMEQNPYFPASSAIDGVTPGFNGFYSYGNTPYIAGSVNGSEEFLVTLTTKF